MATADIGLVTAYSRVQRSCSRRGDIQPGVSTAVPSASFSTASEGQPTPPVK